MAEKTWVVPCVWQMAGFCFIEAETKEQAIAKAMHPDEPLPTGEYTLDSFEVDEANVYPWAEEPPDKNCVTSPDGACVSTEPCMHDPNEPSGP